ncbi:MAG: hypothetical protein ACT4P7_02990 [Gemmatimonadaceae bacterium]
MRFVRPLGVCLLCTAALGAQQPAPGSALSAGAVMVYLANGTDRMEWPVDSVQHAVEQGGKAGAVRVFYGPRADAPAAFSRTVWSDGTVLHEWDVRDRKWVAQRPVVPNGRVIATRLNGDTIVYQTATARQSTAGGVLVEVLETTVTTYDVNGGVKRKLTELYAPALLTAVQGEFARPDPSRAGAWIVEQRFQLTEYRTRRGSTS